MPIEKKQDLLLKSLIEYYKAPSKMKILLSVLQKDSKISLRVIDYLCTNYAKQCDVVYYTNQKKTPFNLYLQYRAQLKAYSKLQFDPFKRHERITIKVPENISDIGSLETTVAQLNFFKWAIDNKVIDYLDDTSNMKKVETHMNAYCSKSKLQHAKSFATSTRRHNICVTVTFQ